MLSRNHQLTPAQVRAVLTKTAHHPSGGYSPLVGYGQINAAAAVRAATHPPTVAATPAKFHGNEHPAGQDGTSKTTHPSLETGMTTVGYSAAGVGLVMVLGAILISVLGRRKTRTDGAPTGPVSPVGPPPAFPGQAPPPGPPL